MTEPAIALVDGVPIDVVLERVTACPTVADVTTGTATQLVVTYLPGGRVEGIHVDDDAVTVAVCARWNATSSEVAHQVRESIAELVGNRRIDVLIADVSDPPVAAISPQTGDEKRS